MPNHSDFFERRCPKETPHRFQHVNTVRFDLIPSGIEEQSFRKHDGEMIAGPSHRDVAIAQSRSKHVLQPILHLPQPLLRRVCTADHQGQAHQSTCHARHGLHDLSRFPTRVIYTARSPVRGYPTLRGRVRLVRIAQLENIEPARQESRNEDLGEEAHSGPQESFSPAKLMTSSIAADALMHHAGEEACSREERRPSFLNSALAAGSEDAGFWPVISSPSVTT